jgi:hypothetical protein
MEYKIDMVYEIRDFSLRGVNEKSRKKKKLTKKSRKFGRHKTRLKRERALREKNETNVSCSRQNNLAKLLFPPLMTGVPNSRRRVR